MINGLWCSWYLTYVLKWLTKTGTKYISNKDSSDERTLKLMNPIIVHKVS